MENNNKNNLGSVCFDKNLNKWLVFYYIYDNINNTKKRAKKLFKTQLEAEKFLLQLNNSQTKDNFKPIQKFSLTEVLEIIVSNKLKNNIITERHSGRLRDTNKQITKYSFSNKMIYDITEMEIKEFLNSLIEYSNDYITRIYTQLNDAFTYSLLNGYINTNPMSNIKKPQSLKSSSTIRALTEEEQTEFTNFLLNIDSLEFPYKNLYLILLYMGLRIGEALALKFDDIDLDNNTININKILVTDKNNKPILITDYEEKRILPINDTIKFCFIQQKRISKANPDTLLFVSRNYTLVEPSTINATLKRTLSKLGINGICTQSLRYTYRDNCLRNGLSQEDIQKLMGSIKF